MKSFVVKNIRLPLIALVGIVLAIYCATIAWNSCADYRITLESARKEARGYVRALAEHASRTVAESDRGLSAVIDKINDRGGIDRLGRDEFHVLAVSQIKNSPQILDFFIADAKGRFIASSRIYPVKSVTVVNREYFQHHRDDANPHSFIGPPIRNYLDNRWCFTLTRRLSSSDGRFAGVAGVLLDVTYFDTFYHSIEIGTHGVITLFRSDGVMLLQTPFSEKQTGMASPCSPMFSPDLPQGSTGTFLETDKSGGSKRIVACATLPEYPMVATISMLMDDVLAAWKGRLYKQTVGAVIVILLTASLTLALMHGLRKLIDKQQQLEDFNESLERTVQEEVTKNREKDQLMINQSRQAAMGEMINSIAHQWRQPLNNLGLIIQNTRYEYDAGLLTPEQMESDMKQGLELIGFMSQTIDDFRNFFRDDKETSIFSVRQVIAKSFSFVSAIMKDNGIRLLFEECEDLRVEGAPNEFAQVLLNLLSNAKDALVEKKVVEPLIAVKLFRWGERAVVSVSDNAGGITADVIGRIFDPYFSTKEMGKGDGIGLYLSKVIVEKRMGGKISVENAGGGASFSIELPLPNQEA